ncbi:tyrosine-type recombinase/integrase [archaeon]|nr:tyrosine-type recombinase/integrase [archaeon]
MTKIDPYKHKERYEAWKERIDRVGFIEDISKINSKIILNYIFDMEIGINVSRVSVKGSRSYTRLNNIKQRMVFITKALERTYSLNDITLLQEKQIMSFFSKMRNGEIKRQDGKIYLSVVDFVKIFKAFWHWHMKVRQKEGVVVLDITMDLDTSKEKPKWVYLNESQIKLLIDNAKYEYKVLIWFLYDTGMRAPSELINIRVRDIVEDFKKLNIRNEISKTFGRKINLMLCSELIKEFISRKKLNGEDHLFTITPKRANEYLKRLAKRLFGDEISEAGEKYSNLTMYDLRHCSCCYWYPRYPKESALKHRFGWKKSDKIYYYSEFLGMQDTITEGDMLIDITKTELEQQLAKTQRDNKVLQERIDINEEKLREMSFCIEKIKSEIGIKA